MVVKLFLFVALVSVAYGKTNCEDECNKSLGMEDRTIKDSQILAQTVYDNDYENYGPQNARLHERLGYRADPSSYASSNMLGIELGEETVITAIATQGYAESSAAEWVESYTVIYEDSTGKRVTAKNSHGNMKIFQANRDSNSVKRNTLPIPILTSSLFLMPMTVNNNVGLRLELYGCKAGYYFVAWLVLKNKIFTVNYVDPSTKQYQEAVKIATDEVNTALGTTWGFLYARVRELCPQSPNLIAMVTAIVEIHCLRSGRQALLTKLKSVLETRTTSLEPNYIQFQHPKRCGCPPPRVDINLGKSLKNATKILNSQELVRLVAMSHSCSPDANPKRTTLYSWKISKIDRVLNIFRPLQVYGIRRRFTLRPRAVDLGLGYAYVQCVVQITGPGGSMVYDYGYINILQPPLVVKITNVDVDSASTIKLSAQVLDDSRRNVDDVSDYEFSWFCKQDLEAFSSTSSELTDLALGRSKGNSGCFGFGPGKLSSTKNVLELNITEMVKSKKFIFKLVVSQDERNASAVYEYKPVKPWVSISIRCLENCGKKVTPQEGLSLEAVCRGSAHACQTISKYTWSFHQFKYAHETMVGRNATLLPQTDTKRLVVKEIDKLERDDNQSVRYMIKAMAELDGETRVQGHFTFVVNSPPKRLSPNASCGVTPHEGNAYKTDFVISCWGWQDEDEPLTYQFVYLKEYGMVVIQTGIMPQVTTKLPSGDPSAGHLLVVEAMIGDSYEDFVTKSLSVKVQPAKADEVDQKIVNEKLGFIRDHVNEGDADRATELAVTLMSAVKDSDNAESENNANAILQGMEGLQVKSVAQATKIAAVVIMATEKNATVSSSSQESAVTLLNQATTFMSSQFSSNSSHNAKIAKNVSSVLLNGIGNVLRVSSRDASVKTQDGFKQETGKRTTKKTLELAMKVGVTLAKTAHSSEERVAVSSNLVDIAIYKKKPEDLGGQAITEGNTGIVLPESQELFPESNDTITLQLIAFKENPYTWDATAAIIRSSVIDVTLRSGNGAALKVANLSKALALYIPSKNKENATDTEQQPRHLFVTPGSVRYHTLFIPSKEHVVTIRPAATDAQSLVVYIGFGFKPFPGNYTSVVTLPDFSSCQSDGKSERRINCTADPFVVKLVGYDSGLYFIAISLPMVPSETGVSLHGRVRRACRGSGGRLKRSCVEVKDPPTTPPPTPMVVVPKYNASTDVNYTLSVTIEACLYWSEEKEKWTSEGCKEGPDSQTGTVHCLCNHLSSFGGDFFVAPNPIDFDKVWAEFGRLGETGNYVVLATVCTMLGVYLVGLIFARRADKRDELKVIADFDLSDQQTGDYAYSISIQTGAWRKSGSTANVGLILYGDEGVTEPIILAHQHLKKIFFARGSVNTFTLSLAKPLGFLFKIKVWHDNSGKSPSWFLLGVAVEDAQTSEKWHFIAHRWLAVEKGDGEIEVELAAAGEEDRTQFKHVFHSRTQRAVGDSHLWVSLFTKPPHNPFTRCQRLSCCMSIIFCAMVTSAMFYRFGAKATDTFYVGPLKTSWTEIKIGIQSGLIAIPINVLVVAIFTNIKPSGEQESSSAGLPHFFVYIGWCLCVSAMVTNAVFITFYSLTWGAKLSNQWLVSMTVSFIQEVCLIQPIKVVAIVCLLSIITRKPLDHEEVCASRFVHEPVATHAVKELKVARILQLEELEDSRRRRKKEIHAFRAVVEILVFLLFVFLLMVVCYGNRNLMRYTLTRSVGDLFKKFHKVNDTRTFWSWTRGTLISGLYNAHWYNGQPFEYYEGFISNRETFLVGMPRLKQVRIRPADDCGFRNTIPHLTPPRCLPYYSESTEDRTLYNKPGWIPVTNVSTLSEVALLNLLCPEPWQHKAAHALNAEPIRGKMATYSGSGFVANLGYSAASALTVIKSLETNQWIDDKTAAVLIECTLFEPSSSLFSVLKYLYERNPTGGVTTSTTVKTITVYLPQGSRGYRSFYQICQVLLIVLLVGLAFVETARALRGVRAYCTRFWRWMDMILISFASSGVAIMLIKEKYAREYVENVRANPFDNWSADQLLGWSELEDYMLSFVIFLITVKFLRLIRFNRHISQMWMTLKTSCVPLISLATVFVVFLFAFASFGLLAFGSTVKSYSSLLQSFRNLLQLMIGGKMSFYQLKWAPSGALGPIFLFAYVLINFALLVNAFVVILNESYMNSRQQGTALLDGTDDVEIAAFLWSGAKRSFSSMQNFFRSNFYQNKNKYEVNRNRTVTSKHKQHLPRLASMDSLLEIEGKSRSLKAADYLMTEVQNQLFKVFPSDVLYDDTLNRDRESKRFPSDVSVTGSHDGEDLLCERSFSEDDLCNGIDSPLLDFEFENFSLAEVVESRL